MRTRMFRGARFRTKNIKMKWDGQILSLYIPILKFPYESNKGKIELKSISITLANGAFYEYTQEQFFPDYILLDNEDALFNAKLELYYPEEELHGMLMLEFLDEEGNQRILASYELGLSVNEFSQEIEEIDDILTPEKEVPVVEKTKVELDVEYSETLKKFCAENNIEMINIPKAMDIEIIKERAWYTARRNSLKIGTLDDDEIKVLLDCGIDFGIKPLFFKDWVELLVEYLKENNTDTVPDELVLESGYKLGQWAKRIRGNFKKLDYEKKQMILDSGLFLYIQSVGAHTYPEKKVIYKGRKLTYWDFHNEIHGDFHDVFRKLEDGWTADEVVAGKRNGANEERKESAAMSKDNNGQFDMQFEQMSFLSYAMDKLEEKTADDEEVQTEVRRAKELVERGKSEVARAQEQIKQIDEERRALEKKIAEQRMDNQRYREKLNSMSKHLQEKNEEIELLKKQRDMFREKLKEAEHIGAPIKITPSSMEKHLNDIVDFMEATANNAGISLTNIYVRTSKKDGKNHVNVRGEISFAPGRSKLSSGCTIKATLYDANGNIEIEGSTYISTSFKGFDTFDIGWNGGTEESWMSESKIRIFVV